MIINSMVKPMVRSCIMSSGSDAANPYASSLTHHSPFSENAAALIGNSVTVVRAQASSYVSKVNPVTGLLEFVAANTARVESKGLLIESAATNALINSNDFSAWTHLNAESELITGGYDGTLDCTRVTITGNVPYAVMYFVMDTTTCISYSVWARKVTGAGVLSLANFGGGFDGHTLTTEWQRITADNQVSDAAGMFGIAFTNGLSLAEIGDVYEIAFAQAETGAYCTSYIASGATAQARAADVYSMTVANFADVNALQTIAVDVTPFTANATDVRRVLCLRGTTQERAITVQHTSGVIKPRWHSGVNAADIALSTLDLESNTTRRIIASLDPAVGASGTAYISVGNEVRVARTRTGAATGSTTFADLGNRAGADILNGHIKNLRVYNVCIPQAGYAYA